MIIDIFKYSVKVHANFNISDIIDKVKPVNKSEIFNYFFYKLVTVYNIQSTFSAFVCINCFNLNVSFQENISVVLPLHLISANVLKVHKVAHMIYN